MDKATIQTQGEGSVVEAKRKKQLEALERIFSGPKWDVMIDGRMPNSDERNARPWHKRWGLPYE